MNKKVTMKLIIYWSIFIIGCIFVILFIRSTSEKKPKKSAETSSSTDAATTENENDNLLTKSTIPEINALIQSLLNAELSNDIEAAKSLDLNEDAYTKKDTINDLKLVSELVEGYTVVDCYMKNGLLPDTYLVFAEVNTKIKDIDTMGPGLNQYYVVKDKDGVYRVDSSDQDPEVANYLENLRAEEDCLTLVDDIYQKIQLANESDEKLAKFYQKYN